MLGAPRTHSFPSESSLRHAPRTAEIQERQKSGLPEHFDFCNSSLLTRSGPGPLKRCDSNLLSLYDTGLITHCDANLVTCCDFSLFTRNRPVPTFLRIKSEGACPNHPRASVKYFSPSFEPLNCPAEVKLTCASLSTVVECMRKK